MPRKPSGLRVLKFELSEDARASIRLAGEWGKPPPMDQFVERELGVGETLREHEQCLVCETFDVETYEQYLFRGPYGRQAIGGSQNPEFVRIEIRQECRHCKVQFWKMTPTAFARL